MFSRRLVTKAISVLSACRKNGLTLATAESCTGGLIAAILTEIPGASDVIDRGFVTYSNSAKTILLGVPSRLIEKHGAVSEPVARRMAEGAVRRAGSKLGIGVTGIAGPGGGTPRKPVGLVHVACARCGKPTLHKQTVFKGDRSAIREKAALTALQMLLRQAKRR